MSATDIRGIEQLVCPRTQQPLEVMPQKDAREAIGTGAPLVGRHSLEANAFGETAELLVRSGKTCAYPVVDGIPILLAPEALYAPGAAESFDLLDPRYAEAYQEMAFYNGVAAQEAARIEESSSYRIIEPLAEVAAGGFPHPRETWVDAVYDAAAQWDAYDALSPVEDRTLLQVGGKGLHAVKFLLAGAAEAWLLTPMFGEALCARALARKVGVADRLRLVVGIAEEAPLADGAVDGIYAGGCVHHMVTELAFPQMARMLRPGGRLAAVEPWKAPLYNLGTRIFGKREEEVFCRPLTSARLAPFHEAFAEAAEIRHGALTRYPMIAAGKLGLPLGLGTTWRVNRIDDAVSSVVPGLRRLGSSIALIGTRGEG